MDLCVCVCVCMYVCMYDFITYIGTLLLLCFAANSAVHTAVSAKVYNSAPNNMLP